MSTLNRIVTATLFVVVGACAAPGEETEADGSGEPDDEIPAEFALEQPEVAPTDTLASPETEAVEQTGTEGLLPSEAATLYAAANDCDSGMICFWTGRNRTGKKCTFSASDSDWRATPYRCSWAASSFVCSVLNKTGRRIQYYKGANWSSTTRVGSTVAGGGGNLACSYTLRSHKPQ
jgi:hypothetical protein